MDASATALSDRAVLTRAARILESFTGTRRVLSLTELTARSMLPKSTAHRLAGRLVALGWLEREIDGYRIGMRLFEAGRLADRRIRLRETVFPYIQELTTQTRLASTLAVLVHEEVVCIEHVSAPAFRLPIHNGARLPAMSTALGLAMLAHEPLSTIENVLAAKHRFGDAAEPEPVDAHVDNAAELAAELELVRQRDYAVVNSAGSADLTCVSVPLRSNGAIIGAIALSGPTGQIEVDHAARALHDAAEGICADYAKHIERAAALRQ